MEGVRKRGEFYLVLLGFGLGLVLETSDEGGGVFV